jgi:hypothetical protein
MLTARDLRLGWLLWSQMAQCTQPLYLKTAESVLRQIWEGRGAAFG